MKKVVTMEYPDLVTLFEKIKLLPYDGPWFEYVCVDVNGNTRLKYVSDLVECGRLDVVLNLFWKEKLIERNMLGCVGKLGLINFMEQILQLESSLVTTEFVYRLTALALENSKYDFVVRFVGFITSVRYLCELIRICIETNNIEMLTLVNRQFISCQQDGTLLKDLPINESTIRQFIYENELLDQCISSLIASELRMNCQENQDIFKNLEYFDSIKRLNLTGVKIKTHNVKTMMRNHGDRVLCFLIPRGFRNRDILKHLYTNSVVMHLILLKIDLANLDIPEKIKVEALEQISVTDIQLPFPQSNLRHLCHVVFIT